MKVHFPRASVVALVAHTEGCKEFYHPYEKLDPKAFKPAPGLILVGDRGVYLMSSGLPELPKDTPHRVVFCRESDPTAPGADFDTWYDNKRAIFGGDDGCELLPLEMFKHSLTTGRNKDPKAEWFVMFISKSSVRC